MNEDKMEWLCCTLDVIGEDRVPWGLDNLEMYKNFPASESIFLIVNRPAVTTYFLKGNTLKYKLTFVKLYDC